MLFVDDPAPYIDGVRINSPHYLCKLLIQETSSRRYTLVVSQYEKMHTIYYTLRAYASCPFSLSKSGSPYQHTRKVCIAHCMRMFVVLVLHIIIIDVIVFLKFNININF